VSGKHIRERIARRIRRAGLQIIPGTLDRLEQYFRLLALWNEKINLTALPLREPRDESVDRLIVEPIAASRHLPGRSFTHLDAGSGSGSPAIPMTVAAAGRSTGLVLVESKTRKSVFLLEALRHLEIAQARVETARFEQLLTRPDMHEAFDILTIRAVRVEARTLLTLQAFLRSGGELFWFRGPSGPDAPQGILHPLSWQATYPLVESLRSRLVVLRKS
jgi:16S rRNA (guanine527-N7)-methyltransferase